MPPNIIVFDGELDRQGATAHVLETLFETKATKLDPMLDARAIVSRLADCLKQEGYPLFVTNKDGIELRLIGDAMEMTGWEIYAVLTTCTSEDYIRKVLLNDQRIDQRQVGYVHCPSPLVAKQGSHRKRLTQHFQSLTLAHPLHIQNHAPISLM